MRKTNPETHQACRSLLQKAVRRGDTRLTREVARHLYDIGDTNWLRARTAVITFEECWPLGVQQSGQTNIDSILNALTNVAKAVKVKDAAGLGSLAYEYSTGDHSVLLDVPEDKSIEHVCKAIKEPERFWDWAKKTCSNNEQLALVESAHKAYRRGGWPWDRAFMQAAAYLAVSTNRPEVYPSAHKQEDFPLWVALDKHTDCGKAALREAAKIMGLPVRQITWVSFYCESALLNEATDSYWWSREIHWRLSRFGLDYDKAKAIWSKVQPVIAEILKDQTQWLQEHLSQSTSKGGIQKTVEEPYSQEGLWKLPSNNAAFNIQSLSQPVQNSLPGF